MSSARFFAFCLAGGALVATAANALPTNLIDPALPLDQHVWALCGDNAAATTAPVQVSCTGAHSEENPATLSHVVGTGSARADLRSGTLRSRSTAQALFFGADQIRAGGLSSVRLYDTITIEGGYTGAVELRMAIEGSFFTTDANPNVIGSDMFAKLGGWNGAGSFVADALIHVKQFNSGEVGVWTSTGTNGPATITTNASGTQNLFHPADVQIVLSLFIPVTSGSPTFSFRADLSTFSALGFTNSVNQVKEAATDFGNTAQLAVIVPEGVTWHSESGQLLVPEPSALVLLGAGLAAACLVLPRRRRRGRCVLLASLGE